MAKIKLIAVVGLISITTAACGPLYQTRYQFTPPSDPHGRTCTVQCESTRQQCAQLEELKATQCEQTAQTERDRCEFYIRLEGREPKWYECSVASCDADYERCEENYRRCFQLCGGSVLAEDVCVANCEKAPPSEQRRPSR